MPSATLLALALAASSTSIAQAPRFASLQGGETLGAGAAQVLLTAGFPSLSATYAQGLSDTADLGAAVELDWLSSELFAGGLYRGLLWRSGSAALAWRGRAGLYADLGASWAYGANRDGVGVQLAPGLALSMRGARGLFGLGADAPVNWTFTRGGGIALGLRGSASYETPLWGDWLVGARGGLGVLFSSADAPFGGDSPRLTGELVLLFTYRIF